MFLSRKRSSTDQVPGAAPLRPGREGRHAEENQRRQRDNERGRGSADKYREHRRGDQDDRGHRRASLFGQVQKKVGLPPPTRVDA